VTLHSNICAWGFQRIREQRALSYLDRRASFHFFSATQDRYDGWTFCMWVASKIAECAWQSY